MEAGAPYLEEFGSNPRNFGGNDRHDQHHDVIETPFGC